MIVKHVNTDNKMEMKNDKKPIAWALIITGIFYLLYALWLRQTPLLEDQIPLPLIFYILPGGLLITAGIALLMKKILYIILFLAFAYGCEKEYLCLECTEHYYIRMTIFPEVATPPYYDTTYTECHDEPVLPYRVGYKTDYVPEGWIIHPFGELWVIKECK